MKSWYKYKISFAISQAQFLKIQKSYKLVSKGNHTFHFHLLSKAEGLAEPVQFDLGQPGKNKSHFDWGKVSTHTWTK